MTLPLNKTKHRTYLINILTKLYDSSIGQNLGFKGGTLLYLIYGLDRFSTDLDFDLIGDIDEKKVYDIVKQILLNYGTIKKSHIKHYTIFFFFSYGENEMNIKIEISKRDYKYNKYELINYSGKTIQVCTKPTLVAHKLLALTQRSKPASRDLYDINFFLKKGWIYSNETIENVLQDRINKSLKEYVDNIIDFIDTKFNSSNVLAGLGAVLDEDKKRWVKNELIEDTLFRLRTLDL